MGRSLPLGAGGGERRDWIVRTGGVVGIGFEISRLRGGG